MNLLKILIKRELLLITHTRYIMHLTSLFLVLIMLFIFGIFVKSDLEIFCIFLIVQFLSITIFVPESLEYDYNNTLTSISVAGHGTIQIVIAKMIIYWLTNSLISLGFFIPYSFSTNLGNETIVFYCNILVTTSLIITSISLFVSVLTINLNRNTPLVMLISSPLYIAFLLYSFSLIISHNADHLLVTKLANIKVLWSFCLIIVPSSIFSCSYLLSRIE